MSTSIIRIIKNAVDLLFSPSTPTDWSPVPDNVGAAVDQAAARIEALEGSAPSQASEAVAGIAEIATQAETNAGLDDLRIVTPLKLKSTSFTASQISDFDTEVSNNASVSANTGKVSFPEAPIDGSKYVRKDGAWVIESGGASIFGTEYNYSESESESSTTSGSFQTKTTFTTSSLPSGNYRISFSFEGTNGSNGVLSEYEVTVGATVIAAPDMEADNDWLSFGGIKKMNLSGIQTCSVKFRKIGGTAKIRRARIELFRIS